MHERYRRQTDDRQTDRRTDDDIANVNVSSRSLINELAADINVTMVVNNGNTSMVRTGESTITTAERAVLLTCGRDFPA